MQRNFQLVSFCPVIQYVFSKIQDFPTDVAGALKEIP